MAAAITVIFASQMGLPVSSTHIAVGAVFGVGFLREYLKNSHAKRLDEIRSHHHDADEEVVDNYLTRFRRTRCTVLLHDTGDGAVTHRSIP